MSWNPENQSDGKPNHDSASLAEGTQPPLPQLPQQTLPQQQHFGQGTPTSPGMSDPLFQPPSLEHAANCAFCIALSCELHCSRAVNRELAFKLLTNMSELLKGREEVAACHYEIQTLGEVIKVSRESYSDLDKLHSQLQEELISLKEKVTSLTGKCSNLTEKLSILVQEKEDLLKKIMFDHNMNQNATADYKASDALTDTLLTSSENEESSGSSTGKHYNAASRSASRVQNENPNRVPPHKSSKNSEGSVSTRSAPTREFYKPPKGRGFQSQSDGVGRSTQENCTGYQRAGQGSSGARGETSWNRQDHRQDSNQSSAHGPPKESKSGSFPDVIKEINEDLFKMPDEYALAHCVGSDLIMSSGIAVKFRKQFRCVPELLEQNKNPGQVAFLVTATGRHIYYLVTKQVSTGKPSWEDFEKSILEWSKLCEEHKVKKIAIPKLGCGRDRLDWRDVENLLVKHFVNKGIEIVVCVIDCESTPEKRWSVKLCHSEEPLSMLDPRDCALVFIASKDKFITEPIRRLGTKYGFLSDYSSQQLSIGSLYHYKNKATSVNVFGLVVKENHTDPISFNAMSQCFLQLRKAMKKSSLWYMGFEAFDDPTYHLVTRKIWTVVINIFYTEEIEVYICWTKDVTEKNWEEQKFS